MQTKLPIVSLCLCTIFLLMGTAFGQLPDFYKEVERVSWVVRDLDRVTKGWAELGFSQIQYHGEVFLSDVKFRGRPITVTVLMATGRIGGVTVDWIQPLGGENAFTEFQAKHGDGVFSLVHRTKSFEDFKLELERLQSLNVAILQQGVIESDRGPIDFAYLDTESEGKYSLGLVHLPESWEKPAMDATPSNLKLSQFAFVIRDPQPISAFWEKLGFPPMSITHGKLRDLRYRKAPGRFDQKLGWHRHGKVVYEWCIPLQGPTVYEEHLRSHGEGFHHLGFNVEDMDEVIENWSKLGLSVSQSGAWGEEGKSGSGRFAYLDTDHIGGVTVELLWNFK